MRLVAWSAVGLTVLLILNFLFDRGGGGERKSPESASMQTARTIELAMFQYAQDNDGKYPTGKSSTEAFQKLVDGNYVTAPELFYLPMPGKTKATSNHLKPENVCYDITADMTDKTPDDIPGVFATGYRIEYKPGGHAIPLPGQPRPEACRDGLPVSYHSNNSFYRVLLDSSGAPSSTGLPTSVPVGADVGPGPYVQLTPDGSLSGN